MATEDFSQKIRSGELVVFPTETVYGLGALASDDRAVRKIFEVKGRPAHNPMILHIAKNEQLDELVQEVPESARKLIKEFWPGPLTICFKKSDKVSDLVTADLPTVCVRRPDHPIAQEFLKAVGEAVAAPSANLSGKPSTTSFEDARKQLEGKGVHFLDGGDTALGLESTVVDCSGEQVKLLRPGSISKIELEGVLGGKVHENNAGEITSPGQLLAHYAPSGDLTVIQGTKEKRRAWLAEQSLDEKVLLGLLGNETIEGFPGEIMVLADSEENLEQYAANLYKFLNHCDRTGSKKIYLELPETDNSLLPTLQNRLEKASKGSIVNL